MATITRLAGSVESYAHKAAKATLVQWLRDAAAEAGHDEYASPFGISWRVNRGGPHWGVWEEYPIDRGGSSLECPVWDEDDWWVRLMAKRHHGGNVEYAHALLEAGTQTFNGYWNEWRPGRIQMRTYGEYPWCGWPKDHPSNPIPTYSELIELGEPPKAIVDVAVQHKGTIIHGFEVVHKNGLTPEKREFLRTVAGFTTTFYVISAAWILSQVCRPDRLIVDEDIGRDGCVRCYGLRGA